MLPHSPDLPNTSATAKALSDALLAEARAHIDSLLTSESWVRENRHITSHPAPEFAFWKIAGNNELTVAEQHRLRNSYLKDASWSKVEFSHAGPGPTSHWTLVFFL